MALIAVLIALWLAIVAQRRRSMQLPGWRPVAWLAGGGALAALGLLLIDFESQRIATRLATPVGLAWVAIGGLALHLARSGQRSHALIAGACWLLLGLGGNAWLGSALLGLLERSVPPPQAERWDAIAVLGGGTALDQAGEAQLGRSGDRLRVAARLHSAGRAPLLVAVGSGLFGAERERDLAAETAAIWRAWAVPETAIITLPGPVNTSQEVALLAAEARARGWRRIALVTSAWHLPRALAHARRHGLAADGVPADARGRLPPASPVFLVPCGEGFQDTQSFCSEVLARLVRR